jgi:fused signal recognition particle receptor
MVVRLVATDWSDLFIVDDADPQRSLRGPSGEPESEPAASTDDAGHPPLARSARAAQRGSVLRRLRESMAKTRQALSSEIQATLFGVLDAETWERLEEALIMADVGASTTASVVAILEAEVGAGEIDGGEALSERLIALLAETASVGDNRIDIRSRPTVIVAVGVNGTGKTTTIGKLAYHLRSELGRSVLLGAADTFRAAASEQLEGWAQRAGCEIVRGAEGSDPGAVAFETIAQARASGADVVIVDTAGRLHTQEDLMGELGKVRRVIARQLQGAPHETLLTLDATTGQNGLRQAKLFAEAAQVTGVVLTKLDGTARGGIALAIARELGLPVKLIGVGESVEDLRPFDAPDFARALIAPA